MDCNNFNLDTIVLANGSHGGEFCGEACAVEWANRATVCVPALREKYGPAQRFEDDHPSISRVVRAFVIGLNDAWNDEDRQRLRPYVTRILGTATTPEDEETRAWLATDWLARVYTPAFLRLAGLEEYARALEGLARIVDATTAASAQPTLEAAREASVAAWDAARDAARAAARAAARDAAWAAARAAAWDAAWDAARAAAWDAAWDAARDAARAAARDAARDALRPTVEALQASALGLLDAMIAVGAAEGPR